MNPFISAIMERSGSMALDAELDYILGEDFFDEGEEEEGEPEEEEESSMRKKMLLKKKMKRKLMRRSKKGKKRIKRKYTKRELRALSRLRKKLNKKKAHLMAGKWVKRNRRHIDAIKRRMQKIRDRARRRFLNKRDKGSRNQIMDIANPFSVKESAVIRGMPKEEQDTYIRNKSISSGVMLGVLASGFYAFWKREESADYILQDGAVMSKGQYYQNEEYVRLSHTEKETWKEALTEDPKMTGGIFAAGTAIGTLWANSNFKNRLKEEE